MTEYQFADISKDLCAQVRVIENLVKDSTYKEAKKRLSTAKETCENLASLAEPDNRIQIRIVANRRQEIVWLDDAIQGALVKSAKPAAKKRSTK